MTAAPSSNPAWPASYASRPVAHACSNVPTRYGIRGNSTSVSGSPKRQLNSSTFGPSSVSIIPAKSTPRYGRSSSTTGAITVSRISVAVSGASAGTGE